MNIPPSVDKPACLKIRQRCIEMVLPQIGEHDVHADVDQRGVVARVECLAVVGVVHAANSNL
jgi:hypothetical protein